ncbi:MAG TPA: hypothetical protein VLE89_01040 [Chlamydiales bacterium]|nr:hypothetical protein [Chlamydiales bacterium]
MAAIPHQLSVYQGPPGDCYLCLGSDEIDELGRPMVTNNCSSRLANLTHVGCVLDQERLQDERVQDRRLKCPIHKDELLDLSQVRNLPIDVKKVALRILKKMGANALYSACVVQVGFNDGLRTITAAAIEALATGVVEIMRMRGADEGGAEILSYAVLIPCATLITGASIATRSMARLIDHAVERILGMGMAGGIVGCFLGAVASFAAPDINVPKAIGKGTLFGAGLAAAGTSAFWAMVAWADYTTSSAFLFPVIIGKGVGSYFQSKLRRFMPV